ncbi:MAG: RagB/SusD family nutrient uptake outer membrane protein [Prevotella sp.]|nr:RagB/SusD family nutrient uptake outer membrane protein [Candidatus Prevotella equi]
MKTNNFIYNQATKVSAVALMIAASCSLTSCSDFLEEQKPQGTLFEEDAMKIENTESMVVSAYAGLSTIEDINASFSLWNYDVRSDDAYKGGSNEGDGDVFHNIETGEGIKPSDWSINGDGGIWTRLYNYISRTNTALALLDQADEKKFPKKQERIAEMKFLRAYGHFQLKRLFKNIPFVMNENLPTEEFYNISNTQYTNDESWKVLADEFYAAYGNLPETQKDKGRPTKAAAAALLAKVYLYKAYRQDDAGSHRMTGVNTNDLDSVLKYTDYKGEMSKAYDNYQLEADFHNNFRPEEQYENGCESLWAVQYSFNDGSVNGNRNFGAALMAPNADKLTTGGHDFYKPSRNLVNAFRTDANGLAMPDDFNNKNYEPKYDNADPRLYLTVGMPDFPFMFNPKYIQTKDWVRNADGLYGYNITLKQNVDMDYVGQNTYVKKCGWCWANSMNRIVIRFADVILMRAEAFAQKAILEGDASLSLKALDLVNDIRRRAMQSTQLIQSYPSKYGVSFKVGTYGADKVNDALKLVKFERRLELAMESERFFDLVRWGDVESVLDKFYQEETNTTIYKRSKFRVNRNEYLPIPFNELQASNDLYVQNPGF